MSGIKSAIYCRSRRYVVFGQYEGIWLKGAVPRVVRVGDFLGAPSGAAISRDEEWLVAVGHGLVAYHLRPPWREFPERFDGTLPPVQGFRWGPGGDQWWSAGRGEKDHMTPDGNVLSLAKVRALSGHQFLLTTGCNRRRPDGDYTVRELVLDADSRTLLVRQEWVEEAAKRRDHILQELEGWTLHRVEARGEAVVLHIAGAAGNAEVIFRGAVRLDGVDGDGNQGAALARRLATLVRRHVRVSTMDVASLQLTFPAGREATHSPAWIGVYGKRVAAWEVQAPGGVIVCPGAQGFPSERPRGQAAPRRLLARARETLGLSRS